MEQKKKTLKDLASQFNCSCEGDLNLIIKGVASIEEGGASDLSFLSSSSYQKFYKSTESGALIVSPDFDRSRSDISYLIHPSPQKIFRLACELFLKEKQPISAFLHEIHPSALVHPSAVIGKNVSIYPYAVIDKGVRIGDNTVVESGVYVGPDISIGASCHIMANAVLKGRVEIADQVTIKPGAVIGGDGFGFTMNDKLEHVRVVHYGSVKVESDVEIGANAVIDRAPFGSTKLHKGSKLDNLVLVAHGVSVGAYNIIVGLCGIAGSTSTGKYVFIGGQSGLAGHIKIADGVQIAGQSAITKNIDVVGAKYLGNTPAGPIKEFRKMQVLIRRLPGLFSKVEELEKKLAES